jgi:catechol 2,3-dioxygenase-like lactoylglutathione lyase family enzyme
MQLDHLTIIAPDLETGARHVRDLLGVDLPQGGRHPEMGTHNLLVRLGEGVFLEVIAIDPSAQAPGRPRWFGLDNAAAVRRSWDEGLCLRGWVVRTSNIDAILAQHGDVLGEKTSVSRGDRSWLFAVPPDGSLPMGGIAPSVIDWGKSGSPAMGMVDLGLSLAEFRIEHPDPDKVQLLYRTLGIHGAPTVCKGERWRYRAVIRTPAGLRELH